MPYKDSKDPRIIAYRKAYYERTKSDPRRKEWSKKSTKNYRENNRLKYNAYVRKSRNPEKCKQWYEANKQTLHKKFNDKVNNLTEQYMVRQLKKAGYTIEEIKEHPELIYVHRIIIKTKRLWKKLQTSKN